MNKILYVCLIFGMSLMLFVSCAPVHKPTVINAPLMKEQGDVQVSGHVAFSGYQINAAAALSDNVGIVLNSVVSGLGYDEGKKNDKTYRVDNELRVFEGGLGLFNTFESNFVVELYGGFGYGSVKTLSTKGSDPDRVEASGYRYFVQPAFGYSGDFATVGFATRVLYLDFVDYHDYSDGDTSAHRGTFFEPAFFLRLGPKNVKVEAQGGFSWKVSGDVDHDPFFFSVGVHFAFNPGLL